MIGWVLIIVISGTRTVAIDHIDGFATQAACQITGAQIVNSVRERITDYREFATFCTQK